MIEKPSGLDWDAIRAPEPTTPKPSRNGHAGPAHRLSEAEKSEAVSDYLSGISSDDIAVSLGIASTTVLMWVRAAGHTVRTKPEAQALERARRATP